MRMKRISVKILIVLVILNFAAGIRGQDELSGYAAPFLRMELSARALALGGAIFGSDADGTSFYYNPAALPFLENRVFLFSYRRLSLDRYFRAVSYSQILKPNAGISVGWVSAGVDNISGRDFTGNRTGNIDYSENAFYFSFALKLSDMFGIGLSGKVLRSKIYTITSNCFALDFGIYAKPIDNLTIGAQYKDINGKYSWDSSEIYERGTKTYDKIPRCFNIGLSYYIPFINLGLYTGGSFFSTIGKIYRFGIEKEIMQTILLRSGIFNKSYGAGLGMKLNIFHTTGVLDYTFVSVKNDMSLNHIFTLTINM